MPAKLCTAYGCSIIVRDGGNRCHEHLIPVTTPKKRYEHHFHNGKNIYKTARWTTLRASQLRLSPVCELCIQYGVVTEATVADHIIEVKDGGEIWNIDNLQSVCVACHNRKTGQEKRKRNKSNGFRSLSDF